MKTEDFNFYLPENLIAQTPLLKRDSSRLLVLDKNTGEVCHKHFYDVIDYLNEGDALVLNDTKVIPARLIGTKVDTNAVIEVLMLRNIEDDIWECLTKPAKRIKEGTIVKFSDKLKCICVNVLDEGIRHFKFIYDGIFMEILDELGSMPLPPYIHEKLSDKELYQTVYAKNIGSAAAPTAGLHFTRELLDKIEKKKVNILYITLHVGLGTLNEVKKSGKKIISVGTTTTRTLETIMCKYGEFRKCSGFTDIFIYPGYKFKAVDNLITNFHLPKSTLIMLVSALAGKENIMNAYKVAVEKEYRFFSFGDAMLIKGDL